MEKSFTSKIWNNCDLLIPSPPTRRQMNVLQSELKLEATALKEIKRFENIQYLGSFMCNDGVNFVDSSQRSHFPKEANIDALSSTITPINYDLMSGFKPSTLVNNYGRLRKNKYHFFIEWLQQKGYLESPPHFVATSGSLRDLLTAATKRTSNSIFVTKCKGVTYLSTVEDYYSSEKDQELKPETEQTNLEKTFMHLNFVKFVTESEDDVNETQKFYAVYSMQFESKRIVVLTEVRAVESFDETGVPKFIEVKLNIKSKLFLKIWIQNIIGNRKKVIVGRRKENMLQEIEILETSRLIQRTNFEESVIFSFLEKALNFIVDSITDEKLYKFVKKGQNIILDLKSNADHDFLPNWLRQT